MSIDEVVHVITVRDLVVATSRTVNVPLAVPRAAVRGSAGIGVRRADLQGALVDVPVVRVVQMAIVEVVDVIAMPNGSVAAGWAMDVVVIRMGAMGHDVFPSAAPGGMGARAASHGGVSPLPAWLAFSLHGLMN